MRVITTAERYRHISLQEAPDIPRSVKINFATLTGPPPIFKLNDSCKTKTWTEYLQQDYPKAFVVSSSVAYGWQSLGFRSLERAIKSCERSRNNLSAVCRLYAVDDEIVFTPF